MNRKFFILFFSLTTVLSTSHANDFMTQPPLAQLASYQGQEKQLVENQLKEIINAKHRPLYRKQRDQYRHPLETLLFFGVKPTMTIIEIDSTYGWYSDILAPFLAQQGQYIVAGGLLETAKSKLQSDAAFFGQPLYYPTSPPERLLLAEPNSADMVLTFRSVHNWLRGDRSSTGQAYAKEMFLAMYTALKPGGILGLVQHNRPEDQSYAGFSSGYINQRYVIELASAAGFRLLDQSDVNRNPKDKGDHPKGVWTLPPALNMGEQDRDRYLAIGESDRFTLKFIKPKH